MTKRRAQPCGVCGGTRIVPIQYGLPGSQMMEQAERGDIELGGCLVYPGQPERRCRACGATWSPGEGWRAAPPEEAEEGKAPGDATEPD